MKSNHIRILFLVIIALMLVSITVRWNETFPSQPTQQTTQQTSTTNQTNSSVSTNNQTSTSTIANTNTATYFSRYHNAKSVEINTSVFKNLKVSLLNGAITSASLKDYSISLKDKSPMNLLTSKKGSEYIASSNLIINNAPTDVTFTNKGIKKIDNKQVLTLQADTNGLEITRTYTFDDAKYNISIDQTIKNTTSTPITVGSEDSLARDFDPSGDSFSLLNAHSYAFNGVAYSTTKNKFMKESFKDVAKASNNGIGSGKWVAVLEHYFMSAWIPQGGNATIFYKNIGKNVFVAGSITNATIAPSQTQDLNSVLYNGPIIKANVASLAPNLEKTLDYGMLSFFSEIIFWVMFHIHQLVGNWGLSIILVTIVIKAIFYPLSAKSYRSMAKIRMLQPRIKRLQETYKDDRQALGKKTMEMYKEEKVNPLSGCLPMVIQIPIFIALYWVLLESVELRQSPFIFWIHDLSAKDPFYILPILMGISMFLQQRLSPTPAEPMQAKIIMFLPIIFTFLFSSFPAGLVLYWLTNNVISILQQWTITKRFEAAHSHKKHK